MNGSSRYPRDIAELQVNLSEIRWEMRERSTHTLEAAASSSVDLIASSGSVGV